MSDDLAAEVSSAAEAAPGRPRLVLIGPMGAGKSRIGKRVSRLLDTDFIDTDKVVAAAHGPIPDLFATIGEAGFRALEREAVAAAFGRSAVVALGGGAVLDEKTQVDLVSLPVALLTITEQAVESRLRSSGRPLLTDGIESWRRIYADRRSLYEKLATHTIDTSRRPIEHIAQDLASWVREQEK
jgi:shikimate kinase